MIRWLGRLINLVLFGRCLACGRWIVDHTDAQSSACLAGADEVLEAQREAQRRRESGL